jgi:hypothetical protein
MKFIFSGSIRNLMGQFLPISPMLMIGNLKYTIALFIVVTLMACGGNDNVIQASLPTQIIFQGN